MISYHSLINAFRSIGFQKETPIIAHFGASFFNQVHGGAATAMGAILSCVDNIVLPAFTFSTMIIPENGPDFNNIEYGTKSEKNLDADIFDHSLQSECSNQSGIDILKDLPGIYRSNHPILSFYGLGMDIALINHSPKQPYLPIKKLMNMGGWVAMFGADPHQNFCIHYAEYLAGRKQFIRWALTKNGVSECPHFPGCPNGFHKLDFYLQNESKEVVIDNILIKGISINTLISTATALLKEDPFALLCNDLECSHCNLVRKEVQRKISDHWRPELPLD